MELLARVPSVQGPAELFAGTVLLDWVFDGGDHSQLRASMTRFLPGARTAWHSHALGQVLQVTDGVGLVQSCGGDVLELRAGDTVWTPPGEWHWHGASRDHFMTHLAVWLGPGSVEDEPETTWGRHLSDEEYAVRSGPCRPPVTERPS